MKNLIIIFFMILISTSIIAQKNIYKMSTEYLMDEYTFLRDKPVSLERDSTTNAIEELGVVFGESMEYKIIVSRETKNGSIILFEKVFTVENIDKIKIKAVVKNSGKRKKEKYIILLGGRIK